MMDHAFVSIAEGVGVPAESVLAGAHIQWNHVEGPLLTWAGALHWLTLWERIQLFFRWGNCG